MKINCDVGEGLDEIDARLIPQIDMASIACGGHAGNIDSMQRCIRVANQHQTLIGAHPSYPDRENFGRVSLKISPADLEASLRDQIYQLVQLSNSSVAFIKPHGALYNDCVGVPSVRETMLRIANDLNLALVLQALPATKEHTHCHAALKESGVSIVFEAFADRAYQANGQLVSRKEANAVLSSVEEVSARTKTLRDQNVIETECGKTLTLNVDTLCIHSDSKNALQMVERVKTILLEKLQKKSTT